MEPRVKAESNQKNPSGLEGGDQGFKAFYMEA
jgi:hypothetical protein